MGRRPKSSLLPTPLKTDKRRTQLEAEPQATEQVATDPAPVRVLSPRQKFIEATGASVMSLGTYRNTAGKWKEATFSGLALGVAFSLDKPDNLHFYPLYKKVGKASRKLDSEIKNLKIWYDTAYDK